MKTGLLLALVALLAAPAALASAPEGFRTSKALSAKAAIISKADGPVVYCSDSEIRWLQYAVEVLGHAQANAFTRIETREVWMPRATCVVMERWLRGKRVNFAALGRAIQTLHHESLHVRGIRNERVAECRSLRYLPNIARAYFGIRSPVTMKKVRRGAQVYPC